MADIHKRSEADLAEQIKRGYEREGTNIRGVVWFVIILGISAVVIHIAVALMFWVVSRSIARTETQPSPLAGFRELPPEPRLQTSPPLDMAEFRKREQQWLASYGWVDRDKGVVHIPIEEAMDRLLQEGWPAQQPGGVNNRASEQGQAIGGERRRAQVQLEQQQQPRREEDQALEQSLVPEQVHEVIRSQSPPQQQAQEEP